MSPIGDSEPRTRPSALKRRFLWHAVKNNRGFTLLELLVVVAIIAILAELLLPAFNRAKEPAKSAACKSKLRQLGIGLRLYVDDFEKYPLEFTWEDSAARWPPLAIWVDTLRPYVSENATSRGFANQRGLFFYRPSEDERQIPYTYNARGASRENTWPTLGLEGFGGANISVAESRVIRPDDMIAISDGVGFGWPGGWWRPEFRPHGRDGNAVFCDGHVESSNPDIIPHHEFPVSSRTWEFIPDEVRAKRWNNDHQAHPEAWIGYK